MRRGSTELTPSGTLPQVEVPRIDVREYERSAGREAVERLREAARPFRGLRLVNLNATAFGGGVAELLRTHVAILRDLEIDAEWRTMQGTPEFFTVTKHIHNALQGGDLEWTPEMEAVYLAAMESHAAAVDADQADVFMVHDPQPCAIPSMVRSRGAAVWAWRCHIDTADPHPEVWGFLTPFIERYDVAIFTLPEYARLDGSAVDVRIVPPSIDPLSVKNAEMSTATVDAVLRDLGLDRERPILAQISRFDPWKDPVGVIDAYRIVKAQHPQVQLVLAGSLAHDDPEGLSFLQLARDHAADDPDVHLFTELDGVGPLEVNALQRGATVVIQKSLREGFGLVVAEAMWKRRPVVGAAVGGISTQIEDGISGLFGSSVEECAEQISALLDSPDRRRAIGLAAHQRVRDRSLVIGELTSLLDALQPAL